MGLGDSYDVDWLELLKKQQESENPFASNAAPEAQADAAPAIRQPFTPKTDPNEVSGKILPTAGSVIGGLMAGPVGAGAGAAIGKFASGALTGQADNLPELTKKSLMAGATSAASAGIAAGLAPPGADAAADGATKVADGATQATTEASTSQVVQPAAPATQPVAAQPSPAAPAATAPKETLGDMALRYGKDAIKSMSKGIIGGNFDANAGSGDFWYDFFKSGAKGGGIDTMIGNVKGGNWGGALGDAAKFTMNNYQPPPQTKFNSEDYKKQNRFA